MRLLLLLMCLLLSSTPIFSQGGGQNFFKYWTYRYRLDQWVQKGWVDLNSCPGNNKVYGYSIPPTLVYPPYVSSRVDPDQYYPENTNYLRQRNLRCRNPSDLTKDWCYSPYLLKHGDGGQHLGWYMAMLASEYKLLKDQGLPTDSTALELYYALETLYRLDYFAENVNPYGTPDVPSWCDANGFFIRQDIDYYMLDKQNGDQRHDYYAQYAFYKNTEIDPVQIPALSDETVGESGYMATWGQWGTKKGHGNALSLDQISHICLGLKCIKAFVSQGNHGLYEAGTALPGHPSNGRHWSYNFHDRANHMADLLNNYLDEYNCDFRFPHVTDKPTPYSTNWHLSFPIRKMIGGIVNNTPSAYNFLEDELSKIVWQNIKYDIFGYSDGISYNAAIMLNMAAVGDSWYIHVGPHIGSLGLKVNVTTPFISAYAMQPFRFTEAIAYLIPGLGLTLTAILNHANGRRMDIYPMFHQQFYNTGSLYTRSGYENLMNKADCSGPRSFNRKNSFAPDDDWANNVGPKEWRASNRYEKPERRDIPDAGEAGHRNGLDYMALYNLFNITFPDYVGRDDNNLNNDIDIDFPSGNYGTENEPAYIFGFNYVNYEAHRTYANAKVDFVSTTKGGIRFGLPTNLKGNVHAYIEHPFKCSNHPQMANIRESNDCDGCLLVPDPPETDTVEVGDADEVRYYDESLDNEVNYNPDSIRTILHDELGYSYDQIDSMRNGIASKSTIIDLIRRASAHYNLPNPYPLDSTEQNNNNRAASLQEAKRQSPEIYVYPNPFRTGFDIRFTLPEQEKVTITVLNSLGVPVLQIVQDQNYPAGTHELSVDGSTLTAGVYCCKVGIGNKTIQTFNLIKTQ